MSPPLGVNSLRNSLVLDEDPAVHRDHVCQNRIENNPTRRTRSHTSAKTRAPVDHVPLHKDHLVAHVEPECGHRGAPHSADSDGRVIPLLRPKNGSRSCITMRRCRSTGCGLHQTVPRSTRCHHRMCLPSPPTHVDTTPDLEPPTPHINHRLVPYRLDTPTSSQVASRVHRVFSGG